MSRFDIISVPELMNSAIINVFDTMLSIHLVEVGAEVDETSSRGETIIGSVGFAGETKGVVYVHFRDEFARIVAGAMLGMEPEEIGEADVDDVIGELSNMIGGSIKSRLCDAGLNCGLSVPSVTRGSEFEVSPGELGDGVLEERTYKNGHHAVRLVVALQT